MRICRAATNSARSSSGSWHSRQTRSSTTTIRPDRPPGPDSEVGDMTQRKPNLRSVREVVPSLQFRTVHGYRRAFRIAGSGPVILLIHGIGDNSTTWETVQAKLAQRFTVIAVDLLGHGQSDKPRAEYSVAAYANGMRDLLSVLEIERATVVGHSLGGGVAAQFAYQFPERCERLVLVGSGGVGRTVSPLLRVAAVPGAEALMPLLGLPPVKLLSRVGAGLLRFLDT